MVCVISFFLIIYSFSLCGNLKQKGKVARLAQKWKILLFPAHHIKKYIFYLTIKILSSFCYRVATTFM